MISKEKAYQAALKYFQNDELAAKVWVDKYALAINNDYYESTPDDMHKRLSKQFAKVEKQYDFQGDKSNLSAYGQERSLLDEIKIFNYLKDFKYLVPQGSVMSNLGNENIMASLSNCVVIPELYDSYAGILRADQQLAQLYKRRCGVGLDISSLRPALANVANAAGTTSGAVSFMHRFSETTREVAQHGRRGALMITMDVRHPDILEFISVKSDLTKVTAANISVKLNNAFMEAVRYDRDYELKWPVENESPKVVRTVKAREIWDKLIKNAHLSAEPGVLFWDRQHEYSTSSVYPGFKNLSTNPCSEIAMQGGDSCRLMAINLFSFVKNPFTKSAELDFDKLFEVAYEGQRLLDDLVDLELEAIKKIMDKIESDPEPEDLKAEELAIWKLLYDNGVKGRRTGLGFTGLADTLAALNLKYDSDEALLKIDAIMRVKFIGEWESSIDMAIERGNFDGFDPEIEWKSDFTKMLAVDFPLILDRLMKYGRRNISISTVAPTGSLSLLTQTSSGIEPVYLLNYQRRRKVPNNSPKIDFIDANGDCWEEFEVYHPKLSLWMKENPEKDISSSPYWGSTAKEIDWKRRIEIQSVVQKYTTHSISSTINLANDVSTDLVSDIYFYAWQKKLKGITIYREGSRDGVLIDVKKDVAIDKIDRPDILQADVVRFNNQGEPWVAFIGLVANKPYEIFTGKIDNEFHVPDWVTVGWIVKVDGKNGKSYDFQYQETSGEQITVKSLSNAFDKEYWNYAKLISGVLRHNMPIEEVVKLVASLNLYDETINTWKSGVRRALSRYIKDGTNAGTDCPSCKAEKTIIFQEGCLKCSNCGFSECM